MTSNGGDQNSGVFKLNSVDGKTQGMKSFCYEQCRNYPGATGCEVAWSQGNRGCYAHTNAVARGNGVNNYVCWVFSKCQGKTFYYKLCIYVSNYGISFGIIMTTLVLTSNV